MSKIRVRKDIAQVEQPVKKAGSHGPDSIDFIVAGLDFLEPCDDVSNEDILNFPYKTYGEKYSDVLYPYYAPVRNYIFENRFPEYLINKYLLDTKGVNVGEFIGGYQKIQNTVPVSNNGMTKKITRFDDPADQVIPEILKPRLSKFETTGIRKQTIILNEKISDFAREFAHIEYGLCPNRFPQYIPHTSRMPEITTKWNTESNYMTLQIYDSVRYDENHIIIYTSAGSIFEDGVEVATCLGNGIFKINLTTGKVDQTFFLQNASGSKAVIGISQNVKMFVENGNIFIYGGGLAQVSYEDGTFFTPNDSTTNGILKIDGNGVIDQTFFPINMNIVELMNVFYHEKNSQGYYYLAVKGLYVYDSIVDNAGEKGYLLRVDADGLNPEVVFQMENIVTADENLYGLEIGSAARLDNTIVIAGAVAASQLGGGYYGPITFILYKINIDTDQADLSFTFDDFSQNGDFSVIGRKYYIPSTARSCEIKALSNGKILAIGDFTQIVKSPLRANSSTIEAKKIISINSNGELDSEFNKTAANGLYNSIGSYIEYSSIRRVDEIDNKLFISINNINGVISNSGYTDTVLRFNMDATLDSEFLNGFHYSSNVVPITGRLYKVNGKYVFTNFGSMCAFVYAPKTRYSDAIVFDGSTQYRLSNMVNQPTASSYYNWTEESSRNATVDAWTGICEFNLDGEIYNHTIPNPLIEELDADTTERNGFLNQLKYSNSMWISPSEMYEVFKYLEGREMTDSEIALFEFKKDIMIQSYTKEEYYPNISVDRIEPTGDFKGWTPLGFNVEKKHAGYDMGTPLAEIFPNDRFNFVALPKVNYSSYQFFDRAYPGQQGDVYFDYQYNEVRHWNSILNRWMWIPVFDDIFSTTRARQEAKMNAFNEVALSIKPMVWSNYRIIKAGLEDYIANA